MKQAEDTKTPDMLDPAPPPPKKRGRPVTGKAMTPAERKAKSRANKGTAPLAVDVSQEVLTRFKDYLAFKGVTQDEVIEKLLTSQLLRKR